MRKLNNEQKHYAKWFMQKFGRIVREELKRRKITQKQFCQNNDLDRYTFSKMLNGNRNITVAMMVKVAHALRIVMVPMKYDLLEEERSDKSDSVGEQRSEESLKDKQRLKVG